MNKLLENKVPLILLFVLLAVFVGLYYKTKTLENPHPSNTASETSVNDPLYQKFQLLSVRGNSSCSGAFKDSIAIMDDKTRLQGSCCSLMSWHRYKEQVTGLKRYSEVAEIPPDPYDIQANLAKKLLAHYDEQLTPQQQEEYDYAMQNSDEKGPCCCKCWRWYVYGGLGKYLIKNYSFTGQQITEVWNLSDGCGGEGDHVNHNMS